MARLHTETQRSDRAGDEHFPRGGLASLPRNLDTAAVESLHFVAESERRQLEAIRPERIGLDDLRPRLDVCLMHAEDRFRLGRVQLVEAPLRTHRFVQHRPHRSIGDENGVLQPLIEIMNLHASSKSP